MDIQDTIDAYVRGQLDPAEKADFEAALQNDPGLASAVDQARLDFGIANVLIEDEVRGWMQEWENEMPAPQKTSPPARNRWKWLGGGGLVLLLGSAVWFFNRTDDTGHIHTPPPPVVPSRPIDPNRPVVQQETAPPVNVPVKPVSPPATDPRYIAMAQRAFHPMEADSYMRGTDPNQPANILQQAADAIRKKEYDAAGKLLRALPQTDPDYISAQILLAETAFRQKKYASAEQAYIRALRSGKVSADAVEWNLLMTYLAQYPAKKSDFDRLLEKIMADSDHPDYQQALELQKSVKK